MEKDQLPTDLPFYMKPFFVPVAEYGQNAPVTITGEPPKRPAIFDDFITWNPYRGSYNRKSHSKHEMVINHADMDSGGEILFESRVDLDDDDRRSVEEESMLKSMPVDHFQSLTQSLIDIGFHWQSFEKPESVGHDLTSLFKRVQEILKGLGPGKLYRDPAFKASYESIRGTSSSNEAQRFETAQWIRLSELFKGQTYNLFGPGVSPLDIEQGELGNCYFLSVASSLAQYPSRVKRLFLQDNDSAKAGLYSVLLCNSGMWIETVLDDKFPCVTYSGQPRLAFNKCTNGNIWGMLLEKAWAKLIGGYCSISSGTCAEGMHLLTGAPTESVRIENADPNEILRKMHKAVMLSHLMTASSHSNFDENVAGILKSHAYSILGLICLKETEPGLYNLEHIEKPHKLEEPGVVYLVRLRNPWANKDRWKGKWSFHDSIWHKNYEILAYIGLDKVRDRTGVVLIEFHEFVKYFIEFDICKYEDHGKYTYWNVGQPNGIPQFYDIEITKAGSYSFGLSQINPRILPAIDQTRYELSRVSLIVLQYNEKGKPNYIKGYCSNRLHTFVECENMRPGKYTLMATTQWRCDIEQVCLNAYGPGSVTMQGRPLQNKEKWDTLRSLYKTRAKMFDGTEAEKLTHIGGMDQKISYKHQILDDGFGYFYFANRTTDKKVVFNITLIAMENLHFVEPMAKVTNKFEIVLPPRTEDIRIYCQVSAPNRIKFKIKVVEHKVANEAQAQLTTPKNHKYEPLVIRGSPSSPERL